MLAIVGACLAPDEKVSQAESLPTLRYDLGRSEPSEKY